MVVVRKLYCDISMKRKHVSGRVDWLSLLVTYPILDPHSGS